MKDPNLEESDLEEFKPGESGIQALKQPEQERLNRQRRAEQEMSKKMLQELRFGIGQWEYKPVESDPEEADLEKYELEDEQDDPVTRQPCQEPESPGNFPQDRDIL